MLLYERQTYEACVLFDHLAKDLVIQKC